MAETQPAETTGVATPDGQKTAAPVPEPKQDDAPKKDGQPVDSGSVEGRDRRPDKDLQRRQQAERSIDRRFKDLTVKHDAILAKLDTLSQPQQQNGQHGADDPLGSLEPDEPVTANHLRQALSRNTSSVEQAVAKAIQPVTEQLAANQADNQSQTYWGAVAKIHPNVADTEGREALMDTAEQMLQETLGTRFMNAMTDEQRELALLGAVPFVAQQAAERSKRSVASQQGHENRQAGQEAQKSQPESTEGATSYTVPGASPVPQNEGRVDHEAEKHKIAAHLLGEGT